jgi:hypothetical protein
MRRLLAMVAVAVLMVSACAKEKSSQTPTPSGSVAPSSVAPVAKGTYGWDAYGVDAVLTPGADSWSLKIQNKTGAKIDQPGVYALANMDGHRVDATVEGAEPLADGESATLTVTWPSDFDPKTSIGMVMLTIGPDLYGGFEKGR